MVTALPRRASQPVHMNVVCVRFSAVTLSCTCVLYFAGVASEPQTPAQPIDYNFAREELMLNELSNDPIQVAIQNLERQHAEDKQSKKGVL